jgi:microcystin-dependent protein
MSIRNFNNTSPPQVLTDSVDNSSGTTALIVGSTSGYPTPPFTLGLERGTTNQEVCLCTAIPNGTTFTVVRGYNGTNPVAHVAGATVEHTSAAIDYAEANAFINLMTTVGDIVVIGGSGAQRFGTGGSAANGYSLTADSTQSTGLAWRQTIAAGITAHTAASSPPAGWLVRNGAAVSRTTYASLFGEIGTTYGAGDGSTTFNLPNGVDNVDVGAGNDYALAQVGGAAAVTLSTGNLPAHAHEITVDAQPFIENYNWVAINLPSSSINFVNVSRGAGPPTIQQLTWTPLGMTNVGSGVAFSVLNPFQALLPIIKF